MEELKKHRFTVELTDETFRAFKELLKNDNTTPSEVLEGFINDLVDGEYSRGSDERMLAQQYYSRCGYFYLSKL